MEKFEVGDEVECIENSKFLIVKQLGQRFIIERINYSSDSKIVSFKFKNDGYHGYSIERFEKVKTKSKFKIGDWVTVKAGVSIDSVVFDGQTVQILGVAGAGNIYYIQKKKSDGVWESELALANMPEYKIGDRVIVTNNVNFGKYPNGTICYIMRTGPNFQLSHIKNVEAEGSCNYTAREFILYEYEQFKPGDKVIHNAGHRDQFTKGKVYEVLSCSNELITVVSDDLGLINGMNIKYFELAPVKTFPKSLLILGALHARRF